MLSRTTVRWRPDQAAAHVLGLYGGLVLFDSPRFSPKWLASYCPVRVLRKLPRHYRLTRLLEALDLLPERYLVLARFDADGNTLVVHGCEHLEMMRAAAREISEAVGVEVKVAADGELVARYYGGLRAHT